MTGFGGIGGTMTGTIKNSFAMGNVEGENRVGGLIGYIWGVNIFNCFALGDVKSFDDYIGGLVGEYYGDFIVNSYAQGAVKGGSYVGGLVGGMDAQQVRNSYATGKVEPPASGKLSPLNQTN